jgi:hypothetical protein
MRGKMWPLSLRAVPESYGVDIRMRRPLLALGQSSWMWIETAFAFAYEQVAEPKMLANDD